ncbi:MAG: Lrp/AsnC family transcriptional regulator [Pseudomonadota bacterium]
MPDKLSPVDLELLRLLQQDASLTTAQLAERVNLSQSPCWRRINQLQSSGVIARTVSLLDREKLGLELVVFTTVHLDSAAGTSLESFEEAVAAIPEIVECYTVAGSIDYMLKSVTRDIRHYERFLREQLTRLPGVREMHSHIAVTAIKETTELPLDTQR